MWPEFPRGISRLRLRGLQAASAAGVAVAAVAMMAQYGGGSIASWWLAGDSANMPLSATVDDPSGALRIYNADGGTRTNQHAFFDPLGPNGRACVTCHQPADAMSLSTASLHERWKETQGKDPVFAAVDGSNCPSLPQGLKSSHSLLLERGVFRIYLPWPAQGADGKAIQPDFTIEVVRDPTGCNLDPVYGLHSAHPAISVFRRPRMVANLSYVLGPNGEAAGRVTADGREPSLAVQAMHAAFAHEQATQAPSESEIADILEFESQVYAAQDYDKRGGDLTEVDGPIGLGAWNLGRGAEKTKDPNRPVFLTASDWVKNGNHGRDREQQDFRESVVRGNALFQTRKFSIAATANLNVGGAHGAAVMGSCSTCHNAQMTGAAAGQGWMDIGTTTQRSEAEIGAPDLPLFKITCKAGAAPHPYLGRVLYTNDPGRALVTGKCKDVGSIVMQQFRGLAARAPYFANGSARDLQEVVEFYDRRFAIGLSQQEKQDLVNFMSVL